MSKFIVKPNKSVKEIVGLQQALKPSDDSGDKSIWDLKEEERIQVNEIYDKIANDYHISHFD